MEGGSTRSSTGHRLARRTRQAGGHAAAQPMRTRCWNACADCCTGIGNWFRNLCGGRPARSTATTPARSLPRDARRRGRGRRTRTYSDGDALPSTTFNPLMRDVDVVDTDLEAGTRGGADSSRVEAINVINQEQLWTIKLIRIPLKIFRYIGVIQERPVDTPIKGKGLLVRETPEFHPRFIRFLYGLSNLAMLLLAFKFINLAEAEKQVNQLFESIHASDSEKTYLQSFTEPFLEFVASSIASSSLTLHQALSAADGYAFAVSALAFRSSASFMSGYNDMVTGVNTRGDHYTSLCRPRCTTVPIKVAAPILGSMGFGYAIWFLNRFINEGSLQQAMSEVHPGAANQTCPGPGESPWTNDDMALFCAGTEKIDATTDFLSSMQWGGAAYVFLQLASTGLLCIIACCTKKDKCCAKPQAKNVRTLELIVPDDPDFDMKSFRAIIHQLAQNPSLYKADHTHLKVITDEYTPPSPTIRSGSTDRRTRARSSSLAETRGVSQFASARGGRGGRGRGRGRTPSRDTSRTGPPARLSASPTSHR